MIRILPCETPRAIVLVSRLNGFVRPACQRAFCFCPIITLGVISFADMDTRRKAILWATALLIVAAGLYAPWRFTYKSHQPEGYHWIFLPPRQEVPQPEGLPEWWRKASPPKTEPLPVEIDLSRLSVEWVIVSVLGAALFFAWPIRG